MQRKAHTSPRRGRSLKSRQKRAESQQARARQHQTSQHAEDAPALAVRTQHFHTADVFGTMSLCTTTTAGMATESSAVRQGRHQPTELQLPARRQASKHSHGCLDNIVATTAKLHRGSLRRGCTAVSTTTSPQKRRSDGSGNGTASINKLHGHRPSPVYINIHTYIYIYRQTLYIYI